MAGKKGGSKGKRTTKNKGTNSRARKNVEEKEFDLIIPGPEPPSASDIRILMQIRNQSLKPKLHKLAQSAMEVFHSLTRDDALWEFDEETRQYILDHDEYQKMWGPLFGNIPITSSADEAFSSQNGAQPLQTECSKEIGVALGTPLDQVKMFMNVEQWCAMFPDHVSKAKVLDIISEGDEENMSGAIQLMFAEFYLPSPLVQTRECYFLRFCRMIGSNRWIVVDVSLESVIPNSTNKYIRRPSGCLIEPYDDDIEPLSQIEWIEHVEVNSSMVPYLFKPHVTSGLGFGASRWLTTLTRETIRAAVYFAACVEDEDEKRNLLLVADRMVSSFHLAISSSSDNMWRSVITAAPAEFSPDIRLKTRYNNDDPRGIIATVATTIWLPKHPDNVVELLHEAGNRHKWDVLTDRPTGEVAHVSTDVGPKGYVSVIPIPDTTPPLFYLQEVKTGPTGTYIVYTVIDVFVLNSVLQGRNLNKAQALLPLGLVVMPDRPPTPNNIGGTLVTIAMLLMKDDITLTNHQLRPGTSIQQAHKVLDIIAARIRAAVNNI